MTASRGRPPRHGEAQTNKHPGSPEWRSWHAMLQRCRDPKATSYKDYGGRGIRVCARWQTYENFLADMGRRPTPQHTLDRKDTDGNYAPDNCRWATKPEQQRNRRATKLTAQAVDEIRRQHAAGLPQVTIAFKLGVSKQTVCDIVKGRTWVT